MELKWVDYNASYVCAFTIYFVIFFLLTFIGGFEFSDFPLIYHLNPLVVNICSWASVYLKG